MIKSGALFLASELKIVRGEIYIKLKSGSFWGTDYNLDH